MMKKKPRADTTSASKKGDGVPSLISADVIIDGNVTTDGEVQFDGTMTGDIRAGGLVIGEGARITGEVVAERVRVCGHVHGVIRASRVDLAASAVIEGDVMHEALTVEDGAKMDGKVCCQENPIGAETAKAQPGKDGFDTEKVAAELADQPALRATKAA